MSTMVDNFSAARDAGTTLTVFNLPYSATEDYVRSLFPTAQYVNIMRRQNDPTSSQGKCTLQFNSSYECQKVYAECQSGKEVAGRMLHAELGENYGYASQCGNQTSPYAGRSDRVPSSESVRQHQRYPSGNSRSGDHKAGESGCNLTVSNLPYSATERDIWQEFPEALKVVLNFDERGRSRGVAQVSFSNKEQCSAALESCNHKTMSGRPIRGRITRDNENGQSRDFGGRQGRYNDEQRDFGGRSNRYSEDQRDSSVRQGKFGDDQRDFGGRQSRHGDEQRDFGSRQGAQMNYNRDRDNSRFNNSYGGRGGPGGGGNRGGSAFGGSRGGSGRGGGGNRFGNRDDRAESFGNRRDRSPGRDEPVRGYGNSKGPRITSAVINRPGGVSSESSSSSSAED